MFLYELLVSTSSLYVQKKSNSIHKNLPESQIKSNLLMSIHSRGFLENLKQTERTIENTRAFPVARTHNETVLQDLFENHVDNAIYPIKSPCKN